MSEKILVIRGGAIGDFILTLPAMALLRAAGATLEVMGYRRVLGLVHKRFYAEDTRSIDSAALAACFNPRGEVDAALAAYFRGFDRIVSYIYDPDELFCSTLRRLGARNVISIAPMPADGQPAARHLIGPLAEAEPAPDALHPRLHPSEADALRASELFPEGADVVIHPGSGSAAKTWPLENWMRVFDGLRRRGLRVAVCGGEAEEPARAAFEQAFQPPMLWNLPLEILAACLRKTRVFLGHDSGISHLACAAGTPSLLLFGPTDPRVWAPTHPHCRVLSAPGGRLEHLAPEHVIQRAEEFL
ncbi:MAG: glycosyltransferase family 9 protein [Terrimicrobiaceae bacterium]|nr:glycosyltransferase family 9 protein [Terrimicrobiaceae bacterium]